MFVGVGNGQIQRRRPDGTLNATLDPGLCGLETGMAFDNLCNLYSTAFSASTIVKFDATGAKIGGVAAARANVGDKLLIQRYYLTSPVFPGNVIPVSILFYVRRVQ